MVNDNKLIMASGNDKIFAHFENNISAYKAICQRIVEVNEFGILFFVQYKLAYISENIYNMLGYPIEQSLIGKSIESFIEIIHPQERNNITKYLDLTEQPQSKNFEFECRIMHKMGHYVWSENKIFKEYDPYADSESILIFTKDITKIKNIIETNKNLCLNIDAQVEQKTIELQDAIELLKHNIKETENQFEQNYLDSVNIVKLNDKLLNSKIELEKLNRKLEAKVAERTRYYLQAKEKANESDRLKEAFIANLTHELKTPLNEIMAATNILSFENIGQDEKKEIHNNLKSSCYRLIQNIDDILEISRIEAGVENGSFRKFNPTYLIFELYENHLSAVESSSKIQFKYEIPDNWENISIVNDELKLYHIVNNLLSNAIKFTSEGSIVFGYQITANGLEYFVKDTGIGIDEKAQNYIFNYFYQEDSGINRRYEGNGLGLAIVAGLARIINAKIKFDSTKGKGTNFYLEIPLRFT